MFKLSFSDRFKKNFKILHPLEQKQISKKLILLSQNPMHPSLRTKKIQGPNCLFECSANMDIRIIWCYEDNSLIALMDVGHHDILNSI